MVNFESDTRPLSECSNLVASSPAQITEINCAPAYFQVTANTSQKPITIVTLTDRETAVLNLCDAYSPELREL